MMVRFATAMAAVWCLVGLFLLPAVRGLANKRRSEGEPDAALVYAVAFWVLMASEIPAAAWLAARYLL